MTPIFPKLEIPFPPTLSHDVIFPLLWRQFRTPRESVHVALLYGLVPKSRNLGQLELLTTPHNDGGLRDAG